MTRSLTLLISVLLSAATVHAADKLVLDLVLDDDLISLAYNIDGFPIAPTMNFSPDVAGNLSARLGGDTLKHHLAVTALVRSGGQVVGVASEHEKAVMDQSTGIPVVESAWLISLYGPSGTGLLATAQREEHAGTFGLINQVRQNPKGPWEDNFKRFLTTSGKATVGIATGDLAVYQGGKFEEYDFVDPADLDDFGRFRIKVQLVIYPAR